MSLSLTDRAIIDTAHATWVASIIALLIAVGSQIFEQVRRNATRAARRRRALVSLKFATEIFERFFAGNDANPGGQLGRGGLLMFVNAADVAIQHALEQEHNDDEIATMALNFSAACVALKMEIERHPGAEFFAVDDLASRFSATRSDVERESSRLRRILEE